MNNVGKRLVSDIIKCERPACSREFEAVLGIFDAGNIYCSHKCVGFHYVERIREHRDRLGKLQLRNPNKVHDVHQLELHPFDG